MSIPKIYIGRSAEKKGQSTKDSKRGKGIKNFKFYLLGGRRQTEPREPTRPQD